MLGLLADLMQNDPNGRSDSDFIIEWLQERNYVVEAYVLEARVFGSLPRRSRIYWVAWLRGVDEAPMLAQQVIDLCSNCFPNTKDIGLYTVLRILRGHLEQRSADLNPDKDFHSGL